MPQPRICVVGTGYVGMACTVGLASLGWPTVGFDIQSDRIEKLKLGITPYRETGIEEALRTHLDSGLITFEDTLERAARGAEIIIIAVGTPSREDGSADLSALDIAMNELSKLHFDAAPTVVIRSTVPPGTSDRLAEQSAHWAELVYAPEFLREGSAVPDFLNPDRIVVGSSTTSSAVAYVRLFERLQKPVVFTTRCNAELIKCCSNAFLALKISFANEVANLCDAVGAVSDDVLRGIGYDRRIGSEFLEPGIGFGGPCFEKDVKSINYVANRMNTGSQLFAATLRTNEAQPQRIISMVNEAAGELSGLRIGIWGIAFKAGTDDVRDSLALRIVNDLSRRGAITSVYDPAVHVAPLPQGSRLVATALEAADADVLLVLTEWPEFSRITPADVAKRLRRGIVIDGRNVLDGDRYRAEGLFYQGVGRPNTNMSRDQSFTRAVV
jgi:UDPglucose 6-dehydrogenase